MQPNNEQNGDTHRSETVSDKAYRQNGQPAKSWSDFQARKLAQAQATPGALGEALTQSIALVKKKPGRKPKPPVEAKEVLIADLLRQAVELAIARRGRITAEERIKEQTLLEVLTGALRRAE
jgi:hypothetical protein